jgi:hypothetical protein
MSRPAGQRSTAALRAAAGLCAWAAALAAALPLHAEPPPPVAATAAYDAIWRFFDERLK